MEKIKQAVEKAKLQRQQNSEQSENNTNKYRTTSNVNQTPFSNYTETKVVKINEKIIKKNRLISDSGSYEVNTSYNILRSHVQRLLEENDWNSIGVTSANPGEGKTLTAVNLALSLVKKVNQTVLLVDLDLRKPSIHKLLGYYPKCGVEDFIFSDIPVSNILFNPGVERLVVLPSKGSKKNSSEILSSPRMLDLIEETKRRYSSRIVIFDLPPLLHVEDTLEVSPYIDSVLLVLGEGKSTQKEVKKSLDLLRNTNVLGTVLNRSIYNKPNFKEYSGNY